MNVPVPGIAAASGARGRRHGRWVPAAILLTALGVAHALVVSIRYHVGSFDDDGSYVTAARAIAAGHGLASRAAGGYPLIGVYPPGYPAILSPFALVWRSSVLDFRLVSLAMFLAIFPLTWIYLGRRKVSDPLRCAVLALLALNPVLATYATMVMAEASFVVVLLLMLLAVERWERDPATVCWAGVGTVACATGLVWMKEAGIGLVVGLVVWLLLRRLRRKAVATAVASALLIAPLVIVRLLAGASVIGSRYSSDLGGVFTGGLSGRILHVAPHAAWVYIYGALPHSIVPTGMAVLMGHGLLTSAFRVVSELSAPLVIVGFVVWCRRRADAACLIVPVYVAETLFYPFTNERRVVLVLPVIVAWYVLGAATGVTALQRATGRVARWASGSGNDGAEAIAARRRVVGRLAGRAVSLVGLAVPIVLAVLALVELSGQFPRDYLYDLWGYSSSPGGSGYMAMLHQLGTPDQVVETDYLWTTALYTAHRTENGLYGAACTSASVTQTLQADHAGFVLTGELNGGGQVDDACILPVLANLPQAVRLYRDWRDLASVFELVGAGTANSGLQNLTPDAVVNGSAPIVQSPEPRQTGDDPSGTFPELAASNGSATLTWSWGQPVSISQISLGAAGVVGGGAGLVGGGAGGAGSGAGNGGAVATTKSVQVSLRSPSGTWRLVEATVGAVGPGTGTPFLLIHLPAGAAGSVTAVRVAVAVAGPAATTGPAGTTGPATIGFGYFHALGPS